MYRRYCYWPRPNPGPLPLPLLYYRYCYCVPHYYYYCPFCVSRSCCSHHSSHHCGACGPPRLCDCTLLLLHVQMLLCMAVCCGRVLLQRLLGVCWKRALTWRAASCGSAPKGPCGAVVVVHCVQECMNYRRVKALVVVQCGTRCRQVCVGCIQCVRCVAMNVQPPTSSRHQAQRTRPSVPHNTCTPQKFVSSG